MILLFCYFYNGNNGLKKGNFDNYECVWVPLPVQPVFTGLGYGPGRRGAAKGGFAKEYKLLWQVTELQERWDPFLEFTYYCTHQGRNWKSPQIHRVSFLFFIF